MNQEIPDYNNSNREPNMERVTFRAKPSLIRSIEVHADMNDVSKSELIRNAVKEYLG